MGCLCDCLLSVVLRLVVRVSWIGKGYHKEQQYHQPPDGAIQVTVAASARGTARTIDTPNSLNRNKHTIVVAAGATRRKCGCAAGSRDG